MKTPAERICQTPGRSAGALPQAVRPLHQRQGKPARCNQGALLAMLGLDTGRKTAACDNYPCRFTVQALPERAACPTGRPSGPESKNKAGGVV
jgi:ssDNA-binding Zn-finger/Zn-ribbon topoisomerase 1